MKRVFNFFIICTSIQLLALCSCHRKQQIVPTNPGNNDTTGNPDSIIKHTKNINGTYYFAGTMYLWGRTGPGESPDTTYNITFHCGVEAINDSTVKLNLIDTSYAPIGLDTMRYIKKYEPNTIIFTYKSEYIPNEKDYDTLRYDYINHIVKYYSYNWSHGQGSIVNSHSQ